MSRCASTSPPSPADRPDITQRAIAVDAPRRTQLLRHLIAVHGWERALVFVATKYAAEQVADKLRRAGLSAEPFHGLLSQGKRNQVLADFKAQRVQVVVSTDLAGRGIDIAQLPVVVNFDLPRSPWTTCTASAAPGVPARAGWRSASSARRRRRTSA
jgi:ATP-dependent RNA helicase RhlE